MHSKYFFIIGILLPENPTAVCNEIKQKLGISTMIVDANDFGQEMLGKSDDIAYTDEQLVGNLTAEADEVIKLSNKVFSALRLPSKSSFTS